MDDSHELQVSLLTLGDPSSLTGGYLYHQRLARLAPKFGAALEFVSFPDRPFPLPALSASAVLHDAWGQSPDVLVIDSIAAAFLAPALIARRLRRPLVGMLHQPPGGIDHSAVRTLIQTRFDRLTYRRVRRLFVASQALADELSTYGYPADLIRVIAPGRDVAPTVGSVDGLRLGRQIAILSVGNWVRRKGLLELLEAVALLPSRSATLHLVGDTDTEPEYAASVRERLARADLADRVVIHGPQPLEQVAAFYRGADVFALTSRREPYGTVYGEAMAYGLPVVGWATGNLPHLARHGLEGFALAPGDISGLADVVLRLSNDTALRQRVGDAAKVRAANFPTWDETAQKFYAELRSVAD